MTDGRHQSLRLFLRSMCCVVVLACLGMAAWGWPPFHGDPGFSGGRVASMPMGGAAGEAGGQGRALASPAPASPSSPGPANSLQQRCAAGECPDVLTLARSKGLAPGGILPLVFVNSGYWPILLNSFVAQARVARTLPAEVGVVCLDDGVVALLRSCGAPPCLRLRADGSQEGLEGRLVRIAQRTCTYTRLQLVATSLANTPLSQLYTMRISRCSLEYTMRVLTPRARAPCLLPAGWQRTQVKAVEQALLSAGGNGGAMSHLWALRVLQLRKLLAAGYGALFYDVDAVWKQDIRRSHLGIVIAAAAVSPPSGEDGIAAATAATATTAPSTTFQYDVVASRGSFPNDASHAWGATLCMGLVFFAPTPGGRAVADAMAGEIAAASSKGGEGAAGLASFTFDDQIALNHVLWKDANLSWGAPATIASGADAASTAVAVEETLAAAVADARASRSVASAEEAVAEAWAARAVAKVAARAARGVKASSVSPSSTPPGDAATALQGRRGRRRFGLPAGVPAAPAPRGPAALGTATAGGDGAAAAGGSGAAVTARLASTLVAFDAAASSSGAAVGRRRLDSGRHSQGRTRPGRRLSVGGSRVYGGDGASRVRNIVGGAGGGGDGGTLQQLVGMSQASASNRSGGFLAGASSDIKGLRRRRLKEQERRRLRRGRGSSSPPPRGSSSGSGGGGARSPGSYRGARLAYVASEGVDVGRGRLGRVAVTVALLGHATVPRRCAGGRSFAGASPAALQAAAVLHCYAPKTASGKLDMGRRTGSWLLPLHQPPLPPPNATAPAAGKNSNVAALLNASAHGMLPRAQAAAEQAAFERAVAEERAEGADGSTGKPRLGPGEVAWREGVFVEWLASI